MNRATHIAVKRKKATAASSAPRNAAGQHDEVEDFEAIEQAVMATPRGRWFLAEYLRRHQNDEVRRLVQALRKLANAASKTSQVPEEAALEGIRLTLANTADDIAALLKDEMHCEPTLPEAAAGRLAELLAGAQRDNCPAEREIIGVLTHLFQDLARLLGEAIPRATAAPRTRVQEMEGTGPFPNEGDCASLQHDEIATQGVSPASRAPSGSAASVTPHAAVNARKPGRRITIRRQKDSATVSIPLPEERQTEANDACSRQDVETSASSRHCNSRVRIRQR